jgi:hypothetical protein
MPGTETNAQLLLRVIESTEQGRLRWEATETPDVFKTTVEDTSLYAIKRSSPSLTGYLFSIRDAQGNELVSESARRFGTGRVEDGFDTLEDLHERARRSAFDVDRKVNHLLDILKKA